MYNIRLPVATREAIAHRAGGQHKNIKNLYITGSDSSLSPIIHQADNYCHQIDPQKPISKKFYSDSSIFILENIFWW